MDAELKPSSKKIGQYLKDINPMQSEKASPTMTLNLKSSATTGEQNLAKTQSNGIGSQRGETGVLTLPNGQTVTATIETAMGASRLPSLTSHQKSSMSVAEKRWEYMTGIYEDKDQYNLPTILPKDIEYWGVLYIKGMAALEPSPIKSIDALIGALRVKRPTAKMGAKDLEMFLKLTSKFLHESGFGYFAIEQGIKNLMLRDDGAFFPTDKKLQEYIYPVDFEFRRKMRLLGKMLEKS